MSDTAAHLAHNLRSLRQRRQLTQAALAKAAGVPRATLATVESGAANPTLQVLVRLATALRVSLEELVAQPRTDIKHWRAHELTELPHRGGARVRRLIPDALPGLQVERLSLPAGTTLVGTPHTEGTREYLCCEHGPLELVVSGVRTVLAVGDVVAFCGDQRHSYRAPAGAALAISVIVLASA